MFLLSPGRVAAREAPSTKYVWYGAAEGEIWGAEVPTYMTPFLETITSFGSPRARSAGLVRGLVRSNSEALIDINGI